MTRANARELAVHLIYSCDFTGDEPEQVIKTRLDKAYYQLLSDENQVYSDRPSAKQQVYIDNVVIGVVNRIEELNQIIAQYAIGWDLSRISRLARATMQLAIFEIQNIDDVPTGVAISEAVRIVKHYEGNEVSGFVNGILGAFARNISSEETQ